MTKIITLHVCENLSYKSVSYFDKYIPVWFALGMPSPPSRQPTIYP